MIINELKRVTISEDLRITIRNDLIDFYSLGPALERIEHADDVLPYLKTELQNRCRISMIQRLYGRYRKLLPKRDIPALLNLGARYGKTRETD